MFLWEVPLARILRAPIHNCVFAACAAASRARRGPGADMRARDARPYGLQTQRWARRVVAQAILARRVVAPYGEMLQAALRPTGWQAFCLP